MKAFFLRVGTDGVFKGAAVAEASFLPKLRTIKEA